MCRFSAVQKSPLGAQHISKDIGQGRPQSAKLPSAIPHALCRILHILEDLRRKGNFIIIFYVGILESLRAIFSPSEYFEESGKLFSKN